MIKKFETQSPYTKKRLVFWFDSTCTTIPSDSSLDISRLTSLER